jgi:glutamate-ammonia-ligase adenylyltransferase
VIRPSHTEKQLLERLRAAEPSAEVRVRCADPVRCTQLFRALLLRCAGLQRGGVEVLEAQLDRTLAELPDPERALVHLDRFVEASFSPTAVLEDLLRAPDLLRRFFRLVTCSRWLADTMVRDASLFRWLLTTDVLQHEPSAAALHEQMQVAMERFPPGPQRRNALRRLQRRELLRIAAADVLGLKPMHAVLTELSGLADAVVSAAWEEACAVTSQRFGKDITVPVAILALGKLGGQELNYSSDIDLMFVCGEGDADSGQRVIAAVKEFVRILTEVTPEGMLYRTDLRLRPDGGAGALALSLPATLAYYESRGALWERQMLLRARPCAGDHRFGRAVLHALVPFTYPRTLQMLPSALGADVQRRLAERFALDDNVKHMRGGIRQIEFSLQVLQMLHAPYVQELRTPSTLQSINALAEASLLTLEEEALLRDAYVFHRRIEHALQLDAFEQTHTLPRDVAELRRLAWQLEFPDVDAFTRRLADTRAAVQRICDGMLTAGEASDAGLPAGFRDAEAVVRLSRDLSAGRESRPHAARDRGRAQQLLPALLQEAAAECLPDEAFAALERLMYRSTVPAALITMLEQAPARRMLLRLAASAPVALRQLETDPLAMELVFSGFDERKLEAVRLQRVRDIGALGRFLLGDLDIDAYSAVLTDTADLLVERSLAATADGAEAPFIGLGLGKYGGHELIPGSDLDVIFLCGEGSAAAQEAAQKRARRLIADLQSPGASGRLYEVDARLRPEGRSAPLVVTREAWRRYHEGRAALWERQALLRARVVGGDDALAAEVEGDIRALTAGAALTRDGMEEIRRMRRDMEPANRFRRTDFLDIKRSPGGLVDCEFAAQILTLAGGRRDAGNTSAALQREADLRSGFAERLLRMHGHYHRLRRLQLLFRVLLDIPGNLFPEDADQRRQLAAATGFSDGASLLASLQEDMRRNRRDFDSICSALFSVDTRQED